MQIIPSMTHFSRPAQVKMGSQDRIKGPLTPNPLKPASDQADVQKSGSSGSDELTIDYSKLDWKMQQALKQGKVPISLFVKTTQAPTPEQLQEMKDLGLNVNPIAGTINTARLVKLDQFAKISRLPYISSMQGATQMRPANE